MPGVRIQHATERNVTLTLVDRRRPYREPFGCPACHRNHLWKTYHLTLDESGACIVSTEITERLREMPAMGGFRVANEVKAPPAQTVKPVHQSLFPRVLVPNGELPPIVPHPDLVEPV